MSRSVVALALSLVPLSTGASPGLVSVGLYVCYADTWTQRMVETCVELQPDLSPSLTMGLTAWRARNAVAAANAASRCTTEMQKVATSEEELGRVSSIMKDLEQEGIAAMRDNIKAGGPRFCKQLAMELQSGNGELDRLFPKETKGQ